MKDQVKKLTGWVQLLHPYGVHQSTRGGAGADVSPLYDTLATPVAELLSDHRHYFNLHHARTEVSEQ